MQNITILFILSISIIAQIFPGFVSRVFMIAFGKIERNAVLMHE